MEGRNEGIDDDTLMCIKKFAGLEPARAHGCQPEMVLQISEMCGMG